MALATLTSKGQVTIPSEIRRRMGLKAGDKLDFRVDDDGRLTVRLTSETTYRRLVGLLSHRARERPASVNEMRRAVRERAQK